MTDVFAMQYLSLRMKEIGYEGEYLVKFRHLRLQPNEKRMMDAVNQLFILVNSPGQVVVRSATGVYDYEEIGLKEIQYEHRGKIFIENRLAIINDLQFLQVIFKNRKKKCH